MTVDGGRAEGCRKEGRWDRPPADSRCGQGPRADTPLGQWGWGKGPCALGSVTRSRGGQWPSFAPPVRPRRAPSVRPRLRRLLGARAREGRGGRAPRAGRGGGRPHFRARATRGGWAHLGAGGSRPQARDPGGRAVRTGPAVHVPSLGAQGPFGGPDAPPRVDPSTGPARRPAYSQSPGRVGWGGGSRARGSAGTESPVHRGRGAGPGAGAAPGPGRRGGGEWTAARLPRPRAAEERPCATGARPRVTARGEPAAAADREPEAEALLVVHGGAAGGGGVGGRAEGS